MGIRKLIATSIWLLALANVGLAQTPYQIMVGAIKIYAVGDLAFGTQEKPGIGLACRQSTGKLLLGSMDQTPSGQDEFVVTSGSGRSWRIPADTPWNDELHGRYIATIGTASVEASADRGLIRFAQATTLLEAIRLSSDTLRISLANKETGEVVVEESFNTSDVDICRFAFACGDHEHIRAACGPSVLPPLPDVQMLKRDIEAVLSRYPTDP